MLQPHNQYVSFENEWRQALLVVRNLLNQRNVSKFEWQDLFVINNRITSWVDDGCKKLMNELEKEVNSHVTNAGKRIHNFNDDESLLHSYITEWTNYSVQVRHLPMPFSFVERTNNSHKFNGCNRPTARSQESPNLVRNTMLEIWNHVVFTKISDRLLNVAMNLVERERNGESIDTKLIVGIRESFVELNTDVENPLALYVAHFEQHYLESLERFYKSRTSEFLEKNGILAYMAFADEKLTEEENRAKKYLDFSKPESNEKLIEKCVKVLVIEYEDQLLAESPPLIRNYEIPRLKMLYRLIDKTPNGIQSMLNNLFEHIKIEGLNAMRQNAEIITSDSEKFVEQLLEMYTKFSGLIKDAFLNDARFLTIRDKAFQEVVNNTDVFKIEFQNKSMKGSVESRCPELLATYCDILLRKSNVSKKLSSEEIDEKLNNVLLVLKYVQNKDIFMRYHKTHLSRRLILEMSADQEKEENLVNRFREAGMPADYVNKLFRMLQDIEINKDLNSTFKKSVSGVNNNRNFTDSVTLKILNTGAWGRGKERAHVSLPRELEDFIPEVEEFYKKQHTGRKLNWTHNLSSGTIVFATKMGKYELEVTTYQMSVLFCWNERPNAKISYETLKLATELTETDLNRTLVTLVAFPKIKHQILLTDCAPVNPKNFTDSTLFWINQDFSVVKNDKAQVRGKMNLIGRLHLTAEQDEQEHDEIIQLRVFRIQEAIVKIMKMRKQIHTAQLQTELVEMLKHMFLPSRKLIKEQIEWLIEQKYLKRSDDDINTFIYVS